MSITDLSTLTDKSIGGLKIHTVESRPITYNMLIYGEPGAGKTVFSGSASVVKEFSPVLILDVEGGTLSLSKDYPQCEIVRVKSWGEVQKLYNDLYNQKGAGYRTIVVDSLSEVGKFCMNQIMADVVRKDSERELDVPSMREWGMVLERMRRFIRGFRDLEHVHTFMTAHIRTEKKGEGREKNYPSLNGQLMREAAGFFDFVFYLYTNLDRKTNTNERILMTAPSASYIAKDRSGRLPTLIEGNPTVSTVYNLILGEPKA